MEETEGKKQCFLWVWKYIFKYYLDEFQAWKC